MEDARVGKESAGVVELRSTAREPYDQLRRVATPSCILYDVPPLMMLEAVE